MARPSFGTDGVRGLANVELTPELVVALGRAAAEVLQASGFVVGRDTRQSGTMLHSALAAGLASAGADVVDLDVLPTAGVAFVANARSVPGAVVSASHNPFTDNGVKFFDALGMKLAPGLEARVEAALGALLEGREAARAADRVGVISSDPGAASLYRDHLVGTLEGRSLHGLHVVVDCANGAASGFAPRVLEEAGANVEAIFVDPDGRNINAGCGSTSPGPLAAEVVARHADLGLALDGDADRLVAVDHTGALLDGDALLALFALDLAARGALAQRAVVVTVMTNLGFRRAMASHEIAVHEVPVGDRQVLSALEERGLVLGGEQSGHIVFRSLATTGDGILTGLLLADAVVRAGEPLASMASGLVERVPQVLVNVAVSDPTRLEGAGEIWEAVAQVERELGEEGRVLLRASGTEPVVRVMVEALSAEAAHDSATHLVNVVEGSLGDR